MSEWRTTAQIEADEQLQRAIANNLLAYSDDPESHQEFMLSDYVVITSRVGMSDRKADSTQYDYMLANGSIPWHTMMGLMDWAYLSMKDGMRGSKEDE
jgi:hypothetical protein